MNKKILLIFFIIMVLISMAMLLSGCDDGDGDDPPESLLKALFNIFLLSMCIFTVSNINGKNSGKKPGLF